MYCRDFLTRYSDYDDSLLPPEEEVEFRRHLDVCASCARYDRVLRKGRMVARQLRGPEPSPEFVPRLQSRLRVLRAARRPGSVRLPTALAAVTVLLVAAAGLMVLRAAPGAGGWVPSAAAAPAAMESPAPAPYIGEPVRSTQGRVVALPPALATDSRDWTVAGVDPRRVASYSPFVTGPPAYRGDRGGPYGASNPTRHTLD